MAKRTYKKYRKSSKNWIAGVPKVYQIITEKIVKIMESGEIPWRKPWKGSLPQNYVTKRPYRGINLFLTGIQNYKDNRWISIKQVNARGGRVKKGEKATPIVWYLFEKKVKQEDGTEKIEKIFPPIPMYTAMFNVEQTEGWNPRPLEEKKDIQPIEACEAFMAALPSNPDIHYGGNRAYYRPSTDSIGMPERNAFEDAESFYATLFHEVAHWSGHSSRKNRFEDGDSHIFGSETYSKEELVAEFASAMICAECGIANDKNLTNTAAYLQSWSRKLKDDPSLLFKANSKAKQAVDWLKGVKYENDEEKAKEAPKTAEMATA